MTYRIQLSRTMSSNFVEETKEIFKFALSKEDNSDKWKEIENYLKEKRNPIQRLYDNLQWDFTDTSSGEFYEILLNSLKNHCCNNKTLLIFLTDLITIFSLNISNLSYECGNYVKSAINNLEAHSEYSIFAGNEGIQLVALLGDFQFMEILVKYGLVKNFPIDCPFLKDRTTEIVQHLFFSAHRDDVGAYDLIESATSQLTGDQVFNDSKYSSKFKRLLLTSLTAQAVLYKVDHQFFMLDVSLHKLDNYMRCLRLYLEVTPDPFVTLKEMKDFLQMWLKHIKKANLIEPYFKAFKELMPESQEKFQPRKLMELCRIHAREYLSRSNCALPIAIENAKLPEKLKDFLSFNLRLTDSETIKICLHKIC